MIKTYKQIAEKEGKRIRPLSLGCRLYRCSCEIFHTKAISNDFFHDNGYCKNRPFFSKPYAVYNSTPISDAVIHTAPQP